MEHIYICVDQMGLDEMGINPCNKHYVQQQYLANGLSTHCHFSTKLMHLHSLKFTLVNKSHSQQSVVSVHCKVHHF